MRSGDGASKLEDADIIKDFSLSRDLLRLSENLSYSDLLIEKGKSNYENHTIISHKNSGNT